MSWVFGILQTKGLLNNSFVLDEEFQSYNSEKLFIATSKNVNSAFQKKNPSHFTCFVGVPITEHSGNKRIVQSDDVEALEKIKKEELYGHYIIVKYINGNLEITNDIFGVRELYYISTDDQLIFSSRTDLLSKYTSSFTINKKQFSSLWLTNFPLSTNSIFDQIERLGPGGIISYSQGRLKIENKTFIKNKIENAETQFEKLLYSYCSNEISPKEKITLALSGGIDSRLLLSILSNVNKNFECYTLLNEEDKDIKSSKLIAKKLKLEHKLIERSELSFPDVEKIITQYYRLIPPVIPITQIIDFVVYGKNYLGQHLVIDGGFGGFYKRQFFKKIIFKGTRYFNIDNLSSIKKELFAPKPNIFNNEYYTELNNSLDKIIFDLISEFKEPKNAHELAEILDEIAIKCKIPNTFGAGQILLDQEYTAFMPFIQKDLINYGMNISQNIKNGSRLFKRIISKNVKTLTEINLVNNNLENNFYLDSRLVTGKLLLNKVFNKSKNFSRYDIYFNSKEYILDLLNSQFVVHNEYVNSKLYMVDVNDFYNGNYSKGIVMDWLLTFILWQKANTN